jgi:phosphate butyryltransferase
LNNSSPDAAGGIHGDVSAAHDSHVLESVHDVWQKGYASPILIGDKEKIFAIADELQIDVSHMTIIKELEDRRAAEMAVNLVNNREADVLMKGASRPLTYSRPPLERDKGLRTNRLLSHVAFMKSTATTSSCSSPMAAST